jgi:hypothetical protein
MILLPRWFTVLTTMWNRLTRPQKPCTTLYIWYSFMTRPLWLMREEHRNPSLEAPVAGSVPGGICAIHTIVLALTTIGFPTTNVALSWAEEVLAEEANGK